MATFTSVVGARPQFVKLAPVARAFAASGHTHRIVHTGQHYDPGMSDVFFEELEIPRADVDLGIGSGSHGKQTGEMLIALEQEFGASRPDAVIVYGDTNSTLAATLAATKMHIPVAHIEAGLRSFNREMPEEINRLAADHCSDRLYAPTPTALRHLDREGLRQRAVFSGDVMLDAVRFNATLAAQRSDALDRLELVPGAYGVVTIHRPVNTTPEALARHVRVLAELADELPLVFPMHPRTRNVLGASSGDYGALSMVEPLGYLDMLQVLGNARIAITDSGGLQKEAAFLGVRCITLREETEWTETLDMGANVLVGQSVDGLRSTFRACVRNARQPDWAEAVEEHYGNGEAAINIVNDLVRWTADAVPEKERRQA